MGPITLRLAKTLGPYALVAVIAASVGFSTAWYIQGLRLTAEKQRYTEREQALVTQKQEEIAKHQKLNEDTSNDWIKNLDALHQCYRSGRCRVPTAAGGMPSGGISAPAGKLDEGAAYVALGSARVTTDCADTTLQLIKLQNWVEGVGK